MTSLQTEGILIKKCHSDPIQDVCVFGERSSGTNILNIVLKAAFGLQQAKGYGWKHGPPAFLTARPSTLFVVTLRDAIEWSVSLYARPRYADRSVLDLGFREFLQTPWRSVLPASRNPLDHVGGAIQFDRHPITGDLYRDIFHMRETKTKSWLGLANRDVNLVILRHETFMEDRQACLARIAGTFGMVVGPDADMDPGYLFKRRRAEEVRRSSAGKALMGCADVFEDRLDPDFESSLGY